MANNRIFRAVDTTSALEKVQDSLGPDAFIIEIKNVGNFVEITASLEEPTFTKTDKFSNPHASLHSARQKLRSISYASQQGLTKSNFESPEANYDENVSSLHKEAENGLFSQNLVDTQVGNSFETKIEASGQGQKTKYENNYFRENRSAQLAKSQKPSSVITDNKLDVSMIDNSDRKLTRDTKTTTDFNNDKQGDVEKLSYGDLLNYGLSVDFIKHELKVAQFGDSISKVSLIQKMVSAFIDPNAVNLQNDYSTYVFLGPPGSGKSTICAKLMLLSGKKNAPKPEILHVTPEKLFEADRLQFHSKLFNLKHKRISRLESKLICALENHMVEISWDFQPSFLKFFEQQGYNHARVKPLFVLPADINYETLKQVLKVCPGASSIVLNKADYGRFPIRNLMLIYNFNCKIISISGDRMVNSPVNLCDTDFLTDFVQFTLDELNH